MTTLAPISMEDLLDEFETIDEAISELEDRLREEDSTATLDAILPACMTLTRRLLTAFGRYQDKAMPGEKETDLLEVFKAFVKGNPSLNAVRDNVRELVYYRNCIDMDRRDALPEAACRTAVRTLRHIYLYLRTRLIQEERQSARPLKPM